MRQSLPERDDDDHADINPRGRRWRTPDDGFDDTPDEKPMAMPSWSWFSLGLLCLFSLGTLYVIVSLIEMVIDLFK